MDDIPSIEHELRNIKNRRNFQMGLAVAWIVLGLTQLYLRWEDAGNNTEVNKAGLYISLSWLLLGTIYLLATEAINKKIYQLKALRLLKSNVQSKVQLQSEILETYYRKKRSTSSDLILKAYSPASEYVLIFFALSAMIATAKYFTDAFYFQQSTDFILGAISFVTFVLLAYGWRVIARKKTIIDIVQGLNAVNFSLGKSA